MNTIVLIKKSIHEDLIDNTDNVKIISTEKSLEEFQTMFETSLKAYVEKLIVLNKPMKEACSKLTREDYCEEMTENMKNFSVFYEKVEEFKKSDYLFEFQGQYIDLREYFWNDEHYYEYEIIYLNHWLERKKEEILIKPEFQY